MLQTLCRLVFTPSSNARSGTTALQYPLESRTFAPMTRPGATALTEILTIPNPQRKRPAPPIIGPGPLTTPCQYPLLIPSAERRLLPAGQDAADSPLSRCTFYGHASLPAGGASTAAGFLAREKPGARHTNPNNWARSAGKPPNISTAFVRVTPNDGQRSPFV